VLDKTEDEEQTFQEKVEICAFWQGCDAIGAPFGPMFKLLLLTAQRRDEVRLMRWEEVDLDRRTWTIPAERAKNGKAHPVALSDTALNVLRAVESANEKKGVVKPVDEKKGLVFPARWRWRGGNGDEVPASGLSAAKRRLDAKMAKTLGRPVEHFTLHDLRRTATTEMAAMGIAPHVVDKMLNHLSGTIRGVAAIYNRHEYRAEQRAAWMAWGERLAAIVGENVVEMMRAWP